MSKEYYKKYYEKNKKIIAERSRLWHKSNNEKIFQIKYPINANCKICGKLVSGKQLVLDHDHKTMKFRAWLCVRCNWCLGWYEMFKNNIKNVLNEGL